MVKICLICQKQFKVNGRRKLTAKYCSFPCYWKSKIGKPSWNKGLHTGIIPHSVFKKGQKAWNKGIHTGISWNKGLKGKGICKPNSGSFAKGIVPWSKGRKLPTISGENHWDWKGGITPINVALRNTIEYEEWRTKVFERDLYTCQDCGQIGDYLHANHIKSFSEYPDLRFEVSNGKTLCVPCHYKFTFNKEISKDNNWGHRNFRRRVSP
jgi:hypothetical protein